jgi:ribosomal protein L23
MAYQGGKVIMTNIVIIPRATEKAYAKSKDNVYVFNAPVTANKQEIVAAVQAQFGVTVINIKTLVQTGKAVRYSNGKRAQPKTAHRKDAKKAYVTLAAGDSISVFDEVTTEQEKK